MNLKTTLALAVLAACALGVVFTQGRLPSWIGSRQQPASAEAEPTALDLPRKSIRKIDVSRYERAEDRARLTSAVAVVARPAGSPLSTLGAAWLVDPAHTHVPLESVHLERDGDAWVLPGGWAARPTEVASLVELLCGLKSRFVLTPGED